MKQYETPINANDETFEWAVLDAPLPAVAVFWSPEEMSRQKLDAVLEKVAEIYAGEALIVRLDVNDAPETHNLYEVDRLPQFLFFREGKLKARAKGLPSVDALRPWIEYLLDQGPKPTTAPRKTRQTAAVKDGHPLTVTDANFDQQVLRADMPVMVDFWAPWCGPCRTMAPVMEEMAQEFAGRALIAKVNVDANQAIARRYGVRGIPTLIFFQDGQEVGRTTGAQSKKVLQQRLEGLL
jgi:thioredoxin 1